MTQAKPKRKYGAAMRRIRANHELVLQYLADGASQEWIGHQFGVNHVTINNYLKQYGRYVFVTFEELRNIERLNGKLENPDNP